MRYRVIFGAVLFGLAALPVGAAAQAKVGVLCLLKSGKVVVRSTCRSGETKLSLAELSKKAPVGDSGAAGPRGSAGREVLYTIFENVSVTQTGVELSQACSAGKTTLSGGCYPTARAAAFVNRSYPSDGSPNKWTCGLVPRALVGTATTSMVVYAICADQ